jgi:hypothetical protein
MALVQLIVEVEEDFKETLKDLAKQEDRTLKAFVTRALKKEAAIAKSKDETQPPLEKLRSIEELRKALGNDEMAIAKERVA